MKCLLDMDGVLVDFVRGACEFYNVESPYLDPINHNNWDIIKLLGFTEEKFWEPLGAMFWAELHPTEDMEEILRIVESRFGQENICILTHPCSNVGCMEGKMRWINEYLPQYRKQYLMGPRKEFCAHPNHWLVDDADHNVVSFNKSGGQICLVPRPWNSLHQTETIPHLKRILL